MSWRSTYVNRSTPPGQEVLGMFGRLVLEMAWVGRNDPAIKQLLMNGRLRYGWCMVYFNGKTLGVGLFSFFYTGVFERSPYFIHTRAISCLLHSAESLWSFGGALQQLQHVEKDHIKGVNCHRARLSDAFGVALAAIHQKLLKICYEKDWKRISYPKLTLN